MPLDAHLAIGRSRGIDSPVPVLAVTHGDSLHRHDALAIRYLPDMFKKLIAQDILRQNGDIRKG